MGIDLSDRNTAAKAQTENEEADRGLPVLGHDEEVQSRWELERLADKDWPLPSVNVG